MSKFNSKNKSISAIDALSPQKLTPIQQLERLGFTFLLNENTAYINSEQVIKEITRLVSECNVNDIYDLIIRIKLDGLLRDSVILLTHLLSARLNITKEKLTGDRSISFLLVIILNRPDMITDMVALYWSNGRKMLPRQYKVAFNKLFNKYSEYSLAKYYNRDGVVKLKDVLFMSHCKPKNDEYKRLFKGLIDGTLKTPDTWEVALSGGADKRETFTRLLKENALGGLALIRNLRNMIESNVDLDLIKDKLSSNYLKGVLVHQIINAIKNVNNEDLQNILVDKLKQSEYRLEGTTAIMVDVSGSMDHPISMKGSVMRYEGASGLALSIKSMCDRAFLYSFDTNIEHHDDRMTDLAIMKHINKANGGGTEIGLCKSKVIDHITRNYNDKIDRIIIITDEQSQDEIHNREGYEIVIMNVSSDLKAIPTTANNITRINGYSPNLVRYLTNVKEFETKVSKLER